MNKLRFSTSVLALTLCTTSVFANDFSHEANTHVNFGEGVDFDNIQGLASYTYYFKPRSNNEDAPYSLDSFLNPTSNLMTAISYSYTDWDDYGDGMFAGEDSWDSSWGGLSGTYVADNGGYITLNYQDYSDDFSTSVGYYFKRGQRISLSTDGDHHGAAYQGFFPGGDNSSGVLAAASYGSSDYFDSAAVSASYYFNKQFDVQLAYSTQFNSDFGLDSDYYTITANYWFNKYVALNVGQAYIDTEWDSYNSDLSAGLTARFRF